MVLSYHAAVSPGSVRLAAADAPCTTTTSTAGSEVAATRVSWARPCSVCDFVKCTIRKASSSTSATPRAARCNVGPISLDGKGISSGRNGVRDRNAAPQQRINRGHKHQRRKGGKQQTADDGACQRRVLLATFTNAQCHRNHAEDHCPGGHQHRTYARIARGAGSAHRVLARCHALVGEGHDQDTVGGGP